MAHYPRQRPEVDLLRLSQIYDHTAAFYEDVVAEHQARAKEVAIGLLARQPGQRFLEVGVGTGWGMARIVAASGASAAIGVDVAPGMLDIARRQIAAVAPEPAGLVLGDATRLPFDDAVFERVLCSYTLEVLPSESLPAALAEIRRVMRPEGRLVTINLTEGEGADAAFMRDWQAGYERDPEYYSGARPIVAAPWLTAAGFRILERRYSGHGAGWPSEILLAKPMGGRDA
jgi:demethylmenaquinone methyltransferase/2-methoxy-6-polyprenyl-1,4-benzoquinol methylase